MKVLPLSSRTLLLAVALAAATAPAAAQGASGGSRTRVDTEEQSRRREEIRRQLLEAVERARGRLVEVRALEPQDENAERAIREVEAALAAAMRRDETRAYEELQRAQRIAGREAASVFDDAEFKRALKDATALGREFQLSSRPRVLQRGYLGIRYSSTSTSTIENGRELIKHHEYPKLLSVDPGSPAQEAGLKPGDIVLAYNGYDLKQDYVPISRILVPGETVRVKVRRGRRTLDIPVKAGLRTATTTFIAPQGCGDCTVRVFGAPEVPRAPEPARTLTPMAPLPPLAPVPMEALIVSPTLTGSATMMGAEFRRIEGGLAEKLKVSRGVVVLALARGGAAERSGLEVLDVVTRADGRSVNAGADLYRVIETAIGRRQRSIELEIVRERKKQELRLAW